MAQIPANVLSKDKIFDDETIDDECNDEDNISIEKLEQVEAPATKGVKSNITDKSPPVQFIELSAKHTTLNRRSAISRHFKKDDNKSNEQQEIDP